MSHVEQYRDRRDSRSLKESCWSNACITFFVADGNMQWFVYGIREVGNVLKRKYDSKLKYNMNL